MTAPQLIAYAHGLGVTLWRDGDNLGVRGPADKLSPKAIERLREMKPVLLPLLPTTPEPALESVQKRVNQEPTAPPADGRHGARALTRETDRGVTAPARSASTPPTPAPAGPVTGATVPDFPPVTEPPALAEGPAAWQARVASQMPRALWEAQQQAELEVTTPWTDAQEVDLIALGQEVEALLPEAPVVSTVGAWRDETRIAQERLFHGVAAGTIRGHWPASVLPISIRRGVTVEDPLRWIEKAYDRYQPLWWRCEECQDPARKARLEAEREALFSEALIVLLSAEWYERDDVPVEEPA